MYLTGSLYISPYDENVKGPGWVIKELYNLTPEGIRFRITSWRKANQIHKWFVDNVQEGEDNCKEYYVSKEQLEELHKLCCDIVNKKLKPQEALPTQEGFFFGDTKYDKYYMEDIVQTKEVLENLFKNEKYKELEFYYSSSW